MEVAFVGGAPKVSAARGPCQPGLGRRSPPSARPFDTARDRWDASVGRVTPWREALAHAREQADRQLDFYAQMTRHWDAGPRLPAFVNEVIGRHVADQKPMIDRLLEDPESLVNPALYVGLPAGALPTPLFRIEIQGGFVPIDDLARTALLPSLVWDVDGVDYANRWVLRAPQPDFEARRSAAEAFEGIAQLCDLAFSWHAVPDDLLPLLRGRVEEYSGKRLIHLV